MTAYEIDPEASHVFIDARSNVHPIHSTTDGLEGEIDVEFDATGRLDLSAKPEGHLSLAVSRLRSGNRLEERELQKRIDARRFPRIEGVLAGIEPGEDGAYLVSGEISFRGVRRPEQGQMTIRSVDADTVELEGSSRFDIRDFNMEPPRVLMLRVEPVVEVRVEIVARKRA